MTSVTPLRPLLFLDFDGVLNHRKPDYTHNGPFSYMKRRNRSFPGPINAINMAALELLFMRYDFEVVISSDYRASQIALDVCAQYMPTIFDRLYPGKGWKTPHGYMEGDQRSYPLRGMQIEVWFKRNPENIGRPTLIIDDDARFYRHQPLMRTDPFKGLRPQQLVEAGLVLKPYVMLGKPMRAKAECEVRANRQRLRDLGKSRMRFQRG